MSTAKRRNGITDREYFELLVAKETAVIMERLGSMDKEHTVQAKELERRLTELNHAHAQAVLDKENLASVEVVDGLRDRIEKLELTASGRESLPAEQRESRRLGELLAGRIEKLERIPWAFGVAVVIIQVGGFVLFSFWRH